MANQPKELNDDEPYLPINSRYRHSKNNTSDNEDTMEANEDEDESDVVTKSSLACIDILTHLLLIVCVVVAATTTRSNTTSSAAALATATATTTTTTITTSRRRYHYCYDERCLLHTIMFGWHIYKSFIPSMREITIMNTIDAFTYVWTFTRSVIASYNNNRRGNKKNNAFKLNNDDNNDIVTTSSIVITLKSFLFSTFVYLTMRYEQMIW